MRKILTKENLKNEENMTRTNFCPVLNNAETDAPIISADNKRKYNSAINVEYLDDEICTLNVLVKNKGMKDIAGVKVTYDTRDGKIQRDIMVQCKDNSYVTIDTWAKEVRSIGNYLKALIHKFAELNDKEFLNALERGRPVIHPANEKAEKRNYEYHVDSFERKAYYKIGKNGEPFFVRASTVHIDK